MILIKKKYTYLIRDIVHRQQMTRDGGPIGGHEVQIRARVLLQTQIYILV